MGTRLVLHSPAKSITLEIMDHDAETNEVTVLCWLSGRIYTIPYDPAGWKEKGWTRQKIEDNYGEDIVDIRLVGYTPGSPGDDTCPPAQDT